MSHKTCFSHCHVRSQAATITTISLSKHTQECMTFLRGCSTCTACDVSVSNWMSCCTESLHRDMRVCIELADSCAVELAKERNKSKTIVSFGNALTLSSDHIFASASELPRQSGQATAATCSRKMLGVHKVLHSVRTDEEIASSRLTSFKSRPVTNARTRSHTWTPVREPTKK